MKANVTVADRKSAGGATREFEFEGFADLNNQINEFIESLPFYKINVEIDPDFEPTPEQSIIIDSIEEGTFV